MGSMQ